MTLDQFVNKHNGKQVEYHSYNPNARYQCVDLVNQYIDEVLGLTAIIGTHAKDFATKYNPEEFIYIENGLTAIIKKGDIPIWGAYTGNPYGHTGIALDGGLMSFTSFDQNWSVPLTSTIENHNYLYPKVIGWLRPKESEDNNDTMNWENFDPEEDIPGIVEDRMEVSDKEWWDNHWNWRQYADFTDDRWKDVQVLNEELEKLRRENEKLRRDNATLTNGIAELSGRIIHLENKLTACSNEKDKLAQENKQLVIENEVLNTRVLELEKKCKDSLDALTLGDFLTWVGIKLGIK